MNGNLNPNKTTKLVSSLVSAKTKEISIYEHKVSQLKKIMAQSPNDNVIKHKYNFAKLRFKQLKDTLNNLSQLEDKVKNLNNPLK